MQLFLGSREVSLKEPLQDEFINNYFMYDEGYGTFNSNSANIQLDDNNYITNIYLFDSGSRIDDLEVGTFCPENIDQTIAEVEALGYILEYNCSDDDYITSVSIYLDYLSVSLSSSDTISLRAGIEATTKAMGEGQALNDYTTSWRKGENFQKVIWQQPEGHMVYALGKFELFGVKVGDLNMWEDVAANEFLVGSDACSFTYTYDWIDITFHYMNLGNNIMYVTGVSLFVEY